MASNDLIKKLRDPVLYAEDGDSGKHLWTLIETHISWVILTTASAFKIKKPVDLGFLDFSSIARREHSCDKEVRLNRRPTGILGWY